MGGSGPVAGVRFPTEVLVLLAGPLFLCLVLMGTPAAGVAAPAKPKAAATAPSGSTKIVTILPSRRPRPATLQPQFVGGNCKSDGDCTVSSATGSCGPCGGCAAAMTVMEAKRREAVPCDRSRFPPTPCSPCPQGPARAVCVAGECIGVADPGYLEDTCASDTDCVLVAFFGCCTCPTQWTAASQASATKIEAGCAAQACSLEPRACQPQAAPAPGRVECHERRCVLAPK